VHLNKAKILQR